MNTLQLAAWEVSLTFLLTTASSVSHALPVCSQLPCFPPFEVSTMNVDSSGLTRLENLPTKILRAVVDLLPL